MSWNLYPDSSINGGHNHNGKKKYSYTGENKYASS